MAEYDLSSIFSKINLFNELNETQITKLLEISKLKQFKQGEVLIQTNTSGIELYLIISGQLEVMHKTKCIAIVNENEVVGEMGVFTGEKSSADVRVLKDTSALVITREALLDLIEKDRKLGIQIYQNVVAVLCRHIKKNNHILELISRPD